MDQQPCATVSAQAVTAPGRWRPWRWLGLGLLGLAAILVAVALLADSWVSWRAAPWVAHELAEVEPMPVALVLGTARRTHQGRPNQFYRARLEAAAALYHQGRVQGILVSGDNGSRYYNEPESMRRDLIALGVPDAHVTLDYAGFRTLDSVVRAKRVFGLERFVIVSQGYHVERGVFIAREHGIDAHGYAAEDPGGAAGFRVRLREVAARAMAIWDLVVGREPKFLGKPEPVKVRQSSAISPAQALDAVRDSPEAVAGRSGAARDHPDAGAHQPEPAAEQDPAAVPPTEKQAAPDQIAGKTVAIGDQPSKSDSASSSATGAISR